MGACYFMTIGGMSWNLVKIKMQIDLENDMKEYREYDLSHEKIKVGTDRIDPLGKYIVLANHKGKKAEAVAEEGEETTQEPPFFSYTMPCLAPYDPTRYHEVSLLQSKHS